MIVIAIDFICCGPDFFPEIVYLFIFVLNKSVTNIYATPKIFRLDYSTASYKYLSNTFFVAV